MESAFPSPRHLPVSLFGSVMSVAGLALAWRLASKYYGANLAVADSIGVPALLLGVLSLSYLAKLLRYPELVRQEFTHPVIGRYSASAQLVVWSIGAAATLALSVIMISRLLNGSAAPTSVAPAWLIAGVGSLDIVVTGGALKAEWTHEINLLAAAVGGVMLGLTAFLLLVLLTVAILGLALHTLCALCTGRFLTA